MQDPGKEGGLVVKLLGVKAIRLKRVIEMAFLTAQRIATFDLREDHLPTSEPGPARCCFHHVHIAFPASPSLAFCPLVRSNLPHRFFIILKILSYLFSTDLNPACHPDEKCVYLGNLAK